MWLEKAVLLISLISVLTLIPHLSLIPVLAQNQTGSPTPPSEAMIPPMPTSEPWWTRPEIFVLITVAIISGVVGPLLVAHYGKRHGSKDETE